MSGVSSEIGLTNERDQLIAETLESKYGSWLGKRYFEVATTHDGPVVIVRILLRDADKTFYYPMEGRMNFADQDLKEHEARDFLLDFMDSYVQEFLAGGEDTYLTIDWSTYDCDGIELQLRGQILNLKLESMADELLSGSSTLH
jgi:hypothetical protein